MRESECGSQQSSPEWQEESHSERLSKALKVCVSVDPDPADNMQHVESSDGSPLPGIVEPTDEENIGNIPLPAGVEIRPAPSGPRNPTLAYWGLAFGALSDKVYEGLKLLRDATGPERPVQKGHVRVRWTCVSADVMKSHLAFLTSYSRAESRFMTTSLNRDPTQPVFWKHT